MTPEFRVSIEVKVDLAAMMTAFAKLVVVYWFFLL